MLKHETSASQPLAVPARDVVHELMPALCARLGQLVRIPSISSSATAGEAMLEAHDLVVELLREAGVEHVERLDLPGAPPIVIGDIPAPPGAPTVLLYGPSRLTSSARGRSLRCPGRHPRAIVRSGQSRVGWHDSVGRAPTRSGTRGRRLAPAGS